MFINEPILMNMFIDEPISMNMLINERFIDEHVHKWTVHFTHVSLIDTCIETSSFIDIKESTFRFFCYMTYTSYVPEARKWRKRV